MKKAFGYFLLGVLIALPFLLTAEKPSYPPTDCGIEMQVDTAKILCSGLTSKGQPCKMTVKSKGMKCYHHSDMKITCGQMTVKKEKCKMSVKEAGQKCWRHREG